MPRLSSGFWRADDHVSSALNAPRHRHQHVWRRNAFPGAAMSPTSAGHGARRHLTSVGTDRGAEFVVYEGVAASGLTPSRTRLPFPGSPGVRGSPSLSSRTPHTVQRLPSGGGPRIATVTPLSRIKGRSVSARLMKMGVASPTLQQQQQNQPSPLPTIGDGDGEQSSPRQAPSVASRTAGTERSRRLLPSIRAATVVPFTPDANVSPAPAASAAGVGFIAPDAGADAAAACPADPDLKVNDVFKDVTPAAPATSEPGAPAAGGEDSPTLQLPGTASPHASRQPSPAAVPPATSASNLRRFASATVAT